MHWRVQDVPSQRLTSGNDALSVQIPTDVQTSLLVHERARSELSSCPSGLICVWETQRATLDDARPMRLDRSAARGKTCRPPNTPHHCDTTPPRARCSRAGLIRTRLNRPPLDRQRLRTFGRETNMATDKIPSPIPTIPRTPTLEIDPDRHMNHSAFSARRRVNQASPPGCRDGSPSVGGKKQDMCRAHDGERPISLVGEPAESPDGRDRGAGATRSVSGLLGRTFGYSA